MNRQIKKMVLGDTTHIVWINSGAEMSPTFIVLTGSETVVSTGTLADSGNGHYYHQYTANSAGNYRFKATGTINTKPFIRDILLKVITGNID